MKIFVDENVLLIKVKELRSKGFDFIDIRRIQEKGMEDEELWQRVQEEKRLLFTTFIINYKFYFQLGAILGLVLEASFSHFDHFSLLSTICNPHYGIYFNHMVSDNNPSPCIHKI